MALKQSAAQLLGQAGVLPCLARCLQRGYAAAASEKFTVEVRLSACCFLSIARPNLAYYQHIFTLVQ